MRGRVIAAGVLSASVLVSMAAPLAAAPADGNGNKTVEVEVDRVVPGLGGQLAAACTAMGYDVGTVVVTVSGWSQSRDLNGQPGGTTQLSKTVYHSVVTATSSRGTTTTAMDVGPDRIFQREGRTYVAVTGRSLTGSGVIGRLVFEIDQTGAIIGVPQQAGNTAWVEGVCAALDPA